MINPVTSAAYRRSREVLWRLPNRRAILRRTPFVSQRFQCRMTASGAIEPSGHGTRARTVARQPTFKKPARMCREPIFSSQATKIPLLDLDRVNGNGSVALDDPPKTGFGPSTIGIFVFPLYDEAIGLSEQEEIDG